MRETRSSGSEGGGTEYNRFSLPLSLQFNPIGKTKERFFAALRMTCELTYDASTVQGSVSITASAGIPGFSSRLGFETSILIR